MLEIRNLTKQYRGGYGIQGLNLTVNAGEVVALLGANGAGKTTALRALMGYAMADTGEALWKGINISESPEKVKGRIGAMIGDPAPYLYLTGLGYLKMHSSQYDNITPERMDEVLTLVGLKAHQNKKINSYSTGMKQRICLAKALLHQPELLILDEPFSGMDIEGRAEMAQLLYQLVKNQGMSLVISSHLIHDIEALTTQVCIVKDGKWLVSEQTSTIKENYPTLEAYYLDQVGAKGGIVHE